MEHGLNRVIHDFFDVIRRAIAALQNHGVAVELTFTSADNPRAGSLALA